MSANFKGTYKPNHGANSGQGHLGYGSVYCSSMIPTFQRTLLPPTSVITQKTITWTFTTVKTSNLTSWCKCECCWNARISRPDYNSYTA